jgi:hypothetical protein
VEQERNRGMLSYIDRKCSELFEVFQETGFFSIFGFNLLSKEDASL